MTKKNEVFENELEKALNQLNKNVNKILKEMFSYKTENKKYYDMDCPYRYGDDYWYISDYGTVVNSKWFCYKNDMNRFYSGNTFPTEQSAKLEAERRRLLTLFNAFRDECNGDWKPNWNDPYQDKYIIKRQDKTNFYTQLYFMVNEFNLFGYFKNEKDAERAIELFGDEIKKLFIDCECE